MAPAAAAVTGQPVPDLDPAAVRGAVDAALAPYGDADQLLATLLRKVAFDVDLAESPASRAAALRLLLELADRLDLVPLAPGRAGRGSPPAAAGPAPGAEDDDGNVFGVPDLPPGVGDTP